MLNIKAVWDEYLKMGGKPNPTDFGVYLIQQGNFPDDFGSSGAEYASSLEYGSPSARAGMLVGRLERFLSLQAKPRLKKAGLHNFDDFGLLATLYFKPNITKGQLLRQSLVEPATGTEMMKRMKKAGWILEKPNPDDGRSIMVTLSAKGKKMLDACFQELEGLTGVLDALTKDEQFAIVGMLERLDDCHSENAGVQSISTWMQQINPFVSK